MKECPMPHIGDCKKEKCQIWCGTAEQGECAIKLIAKSLNVLAGKGE